MKSCVFVCSSHVRYVIELKYTCMNDSVLCYDSLDCVSLCGCILIVIFLIIPNHLETNVVNHSLKILWSSNGVKQFYQRTPDSLNLGLFAIWV